MTSTPKYVLLRGNHHKNVFWTTAIITDDQYLEDGYEVLFRGDDIKEIIRKWDGYNPNPFFLF